MKYHKVIKNNKFVGRMYYKNRLSEIDKKNEASVLVVYGRRRVGKTELIEQYFCDRNILKFEGIQPDRKTRRSSKDERIRQIRECLRRLGKYAEKEHEYKHMRITRWSDFFDLLVPYVEKDNIVLYFEEAQWLANYHDEFLAELKPFWDDILRHNKKLRLIFAGSSPSFIVGQFMSNSAFYCRSENFIHLPPFNLMEINEYLTSKGRREVMLAAITTGGVCEYLKQVKDEPSIFTGLCRKSFEPNSFFSVECDKIFISSLSANPHYKNIVKYLAFKKFADRKEIYKAVVSGKSNSESSLPGGNFTRLLDDLESLGFIKKYTPLISDNDKSRLARYFISDEYLHFYYKFINPKIRQINDGKFIKNPSSSINTQDFAKVMGFSFERWCRNNEMVFASIMNFGNVDYQVGAFFNRKTIADMPGFQIDLMYIRRDHKVIICEIKYYDDGVGNRIVGDIVKKVEAFKEYNPNYKNYTFETALITTEGTTKALLKKEFFDYIITFDDIFKPIHWD